MVETHFPSYSPGYAEAVRREALRLRDIVDLWGQILLDEGRVSDVDYGNAISGVDTMVDDIWTIVADTYENGNACFTIKEGRRDVCSCDTLLDAQFILKLRCAHEPWPEDSVYETMRSQRDAAELRSAESIRLSSDVMLAAKDAADRDGQTLDEWVSECVQYYLSGA